MTRILVVSTHPDDETLGSGGTLLHHRERGDELHWLIVTVPHEPQWSRAVVEQKAREVEAVAAAYGMSDVHKLGFPAARVDGVPQADLIGEIDRVVRAVGPHVVYSMWRGDVHTDHRHAFDALSAVLKPFRQSIHGVETWLAYETISSTEQAPPGVHEPFQAQVLVDVSAHLDEKVAIMSLFETEVQDDPLPRGPAAMRALARYRGSMIGVDAAEAFILMRRIGIGL